MDDKIYSIPKNINECLVVLDEIFNENESDNDQEWFKNSNEKEVVSGLHHGLGKWIRNTWGLWSKDTELYYVLNSLGLWHADDMSSVIMTSYHRKLNGNELKLKEQIEFHVNYWNEYEKTNGPVEKK